MADTEKQFETENTGEPIKPLPVTNRFCQCEDMYLKCEYALAPKNCKCGLTGDHRHCDKCGGWLRLSETEEKQIRAADETKRRRWTDDPTGVPPMADKDVFDGCGAKVWLNETHGVVSDLWYPKEHSSPFARPTKVVIYCGDKQGNICPSCVKAARAERDEVKQVLDDSGQVEGWNTPEDACLLARRVKAIVVCRDANGDTIDEAKRHIETLTATLKAYKGLWDSLVWFEQAGANVFLTDAMVAAKDANLLPGEGETEGTENDS